MENRRQGACTTSEFIQERVKVFYLDNETGVGRDDYEADLDEAINVFDELSDALGSFFGLVNESGKIVQFARVGDDQWIINIPLPEKSGALEKYCGYETCKQVIIDYYHGITPILLEGLTFQKF